MRIDENKVFIFTFSTGDHGDLAIPVRGENREAAGARLQQMFSGFQTELAMEFPTVRAAAGPAMVETGIETPGAIPPEVLEMRIETLMSDMGAPNLTDQAKALQVKRWTKIAYEPKNYPSIITKLEEIQAGKDDA